MLGAFFRGQMLVMFALSCIYSLGLSFVGLELALSIGITAGLLSMIPYLGFIVGTAAAMFAGWLQYHSWAAIGKILGVFLVGQVLEGTFLTPKLVGDRIGLHPLAVILAVLVGGQWFGFIGVLLALPVSAVGVVFFRYLYDLYVAEEPLSQ